MHILIIPSWYPHKKHPAGLFIYEQILAIGKYSDFYISVLNWGPNEFVLKLRNPWDSLLNLLRYPFTKRRIININKQITEYFYPHITWSSVILNGNYDSLNKKVYALISRIQTDKGKIDIIHAHVTFPAGYIAMSLCSRFSIPYVITEHSGPFPFKEFVKHDSIKLILINPLKCAKKIIAVSTFLSMSIEKITSIKPVVIPNSVDTDLFIYGKSKHHNSVPVIFTLSHITMAKGVGDLLEALKIVKQDGYVFDYRIGGSGEMLTHYQKVSKKYGLSQQITWLGFINREEAVREYQNCDFYVMPSRIESLSMVIIEAMACGKPIVATDCGGPKDLINDINGVLVKPNDPKLLAEGIEKMLNTYNEYNAKRIRDDCLARFSNQIIVAQLKDIYSTVIGDKELD